MPQIKPLNIGTIGYGFMGRAHSNAYRKVNNFFPLDYRPVLKAACGRDRAKVQQFADTWGYESIETDWRKLLERKDIDVVDICTPNNTHAEIVQSCRNLARKWKIFPSRPSSMSCFASVTAGTRR